MPFGNFEGSPPEKLQQVRNFVAKYLENADCILCEGGSEIRIRADRFDGVRHEEVLQIEYLPVEIVRHAIIRLGKATRSPNVISDWERWATAWHLLKVHGEGAIEFAEQQIHRLREDGAPSGVLVWEDVRRRIAVLRANPEAWAGRS
jgi:hypothetical protein